MTPTSLAVISTIRDLLEADTIFFRLVVALPDPLRTRCIGNRARVTQDVLRLMHAILEPVQPQRYVVNIPLGAGEWHAPGAFDDVPIVPTTAQLMAAFEHDVTIADTNCAVCQEAVSTGTRLRNCQHVFHRGCITQWLGTSARCPVCRDDVREQRAADRLGPTTSA